MGVSINQIGVDQTFSTNAWSGLTAVFVEDPLVFADVTVVARRPSTNDVAVWQLKALYRKDGSDPVQLVGSVLDTITPQKTLGALLWDTRVSLNSDDYIYFEVKGASGSAVQWSIFGALTAQHPA